MKCQKMKNNGRFCYRGNFFIYVLSLGEVIRRKYTSCIGFQNKTLKVNLYSQNVCANIKDVSFIYICPFSLRANSIFSQFIELEKLSASPLSFQSMCCRFLKIFFKIFSFFTVAMVDRMRSHPMSHAQPLGPNYTEYDWLLLTSSLFTVI